MANKRAPLFAHVSEQRLAFSHRLRVLLTRFEFLKKQRSQLSNGSFWPKMKDIIHPKPASARCCQYQAHTFLSSAVQKACQVDVLLKKGCSTHLGKGRSEQGRPSTPTSYLKRAIENSRREQAKLHSATGAAPFRLHIEQSLL
jgi:hypothetical protein